MWPENGARQMVEILFKSYLKSLNLEFRMISNNIFDQI